MHEDDERVAGANKRRKPEIKDASALPAQLGSKLRTLFSDVEAQPVPPRLRELLEALAAKEEKSE
jgi:Anti-sigma factor NepR